MADESKVAGVAEAVKAAKGTAAKKQGSKAKAKAKAKARPHKMPTPRKRKGAKPSEPTTPKPKAEKAEKAEPTSGQSAPPKELSVEALNAKEAKIFAALNGEGSGVRSILTITELAETCFKSQGKKRSNSWARNSLRRLVQCGLIEKVERGKYRVSEAGRKKMARAA
jgi:hypothetical protein